MVDYLSDIYDFLAKQDSTFSGDVDIEKFKSDMQNDSYAKEIYKYLSSVDNSFSGDVDETSFLNAVKKKDLFQSSSISESLLGKNLQAPTKDSTSDLVEQDSTLPAEEFNYDPKLIAKQDSITLQEQLSNQTSQMLGMDKMAFKPDATSVSPPNIKINHPLDYQYNAPTGDTFAYPQNYLDTAYPSGVLEVQSNVDEAKANYMSEKGYKDLFAKEMELIGKIKYHEEIERNPDEYLEKNLTEGFPLEIQRGAAISLHREQSINLHTELDELQDNEEYQQEAINFENTLYDNLKESVPDKDEDFYIQTLIPLGVNPENIRNAGFIDNKPASTKEIYDYLLENQRKVENNPDIVLIKDDPFNPAIKALKGLRETQINAGGNVAADFFSSFYNRAVQFSGGLVEANSMVNPFAVIANEALYKPEGFDPKNSVAQFLGDDGTMYQNHYSRMMVEGSPLAKKIKAHSNKFSERKLRRFKYGIAESIYNLRAGDAIHQVMNMMGSAMFDIGLFFSTGGYGLSLSSASAFGDAALQTKEYNRTADPEDRISLGGIYANAAITAAIIYATDKFTLNNVKALKKQVDDSINTLRLSGIKEGTDNIIIQPTTGEAFINGLTRNPKEKIVVSGLKESSTETLQEIGGKVTDYFTGTLEEDESILSIDMLDVFIGSFLPGAAPNMSGRTISYFADQYVEAQKNAKFTVENTESGYIRTFSRKQFIEYKSKKDNIKKYRNGKEKWRAKNANQISSKIKILLTNLGTEENIKQREQMRAFEKEIDALSVELNLASKKNAPTDEIIEIAKKISSVKNKMINLDNSNNFVGINSRHLNYLKDDGDLNKFLKSKGISIRSKLSSRVTNKNKLNVVNTSVDQPINSQEELNSVQAQINRKLKNPNVVTKETTQEVSKGREILVKAEVEMNKFSSLDAAKKAVRDYKLAQVFDKLNKDVDRTVNSKAFKSSSILDLDEMSDTEFEEMIKNRDYHVISAEKSELNSLENSNRTQSLERRLKNENINYKKTTSVNNGVRQTSFIIKGKTDSEALYLADLVDQNSVLSGKSGLLFTNGASQSNFGDILVDKDLDTDDKIDSSKALNQKNSTIINVDGRKVVLSHRLDSKVNYKKKFEGPQDSEALQDYLNNFVPGGVAKFLMPALKFLNNIKGLSFNFYQDSEAVLRDIISEVYEQRFPNQGPLNQENITIDLNPISDKVEVILNKELENQLKKIGILGDVAARIDEVKSRGFFQSSDGSISINLDRVKANTLFHEMGHPIHEFLEKYDVDKFNEINRELKGKRRWVTKNGIPTRQSYYEWASTNSVYQRQAKNYAKANKNKDGKSEAQLIDDFYFGEAFSEYLADASAKKLNPSKARSFLNFIAKNFPSKIKEDLENLNLGDLEKLDDFINNISTAFTVGKTISYNKDNVNIEFEVSESLDQKIKKSKVSRSALDDSDLGQAYNGQAVAEGSIISIDETKVNRVSNISEDNPSISRNINIDKLEIVDPSIISGENVFVSAIDKSTTGIIISPTGITHNMMGGVLYSMQNGAGIWAFTNKQQANKFLNNLKSKGVSRVVLMSQADTGVLGSINFNDYIIKEFENSINKKLITKKEFFNMINTKLSRRDILLKSLAKPADNVNPFEPVKTPIKNMSQFKDALLKMGTVNRNLFGRDIILNNKTFLDKASIPRFENMLSYINDPVISQAVNGDLVATLEIDLNSSVRQTKEGDKAHHPSYPFVVEGTGLQVFDKFLDVREAFPKFKIKEGEPELQQKRVNDAARTMGLTTQAAIISTRKTARLSVVGTNSELNNTALENYYIALNMEDQGRSAEDIKRVTMWEKGSDNFWRYEIGDGDFKDSFKNIVNFATEEINNLFNDDLDFKKAYLASEQTEDGRGLPPFDFVSDLENKTLFLKDIIDDPVLSFYPEINDVPINIFFQTRGKEGELRGSFDFKTKLISLNVNKDTDIDELFSTLKHEIQHYIQDKEGFPSGANPDFFKNLSKRNFSSAIDAEEKLSFDTKEQLKNAYENIIDQRTKDRNFSNKIGRLIRKLDKDLDSLFRGNIKQLPSLSSYKFLSDESTFTGNTTVSGTSLKKEIDDYISLDLDNNRILQASIKAFENTSKKPPKLDLFIKNSKASIVLEARHEQIKDQISKKYSKGNLYRAVYGELEARAVQERLSMSEQNRRNTLVKDTIDSMFKRNLGLQENIIFFRTLKDLENQKKQPDLIRQDLEAARENELLPKKKTKLIEVEEDQDKKYPTIKRFQDVEEDYQQIESNGFRSMVFESILNLSDEVRPSSDWIKSIKDFPGVALEFEAMNIESILNNFQSENNLNALTKTQVLDLVSNNILSEQDSELINLPRLQLDNDDEFLNFSTPALDILFGLKKLAIEGDYFLGEYLTRKYNERAGFTTRITGQVTESDPLKIRATRFLFDPENTFGDPRLTDLFLKSQGEVVLAMDRAKRKAQIFQLAFAQSKKNYTPRELSNYLRGYEEILLEDGTSEIKYLDKNDLDEEVTISLFGKKQKVNLRDLMIDMRQDIDELSAKGLSTGAFTGDMAASVKDNLGIYIHRSYKKHSTSSYDIPPELVNKSKQLIRKGILETTNLDEVTNAEQIEQLTETIFGATFGKSNNRDISQQDLSQSQVGIVRSIFSQRQDIIMEIREVMGEIHDPLINYLETISKLNKSISTHFMLDKMQKLGEGRFWSSEMVEGQIISKGLSKRLGPQFGAFEGHYVSDEIFAVLNNVYRDSQKTGLSYLIYSATLLTKWSKTIGNIPTHLRNLLGNINFVIQSGHLPITPERMKFAVASFKTVVNNFRYKPEAKQQEVYDYLKSKGILTTDTEIGLLNDVYEDLNRNNFDIALNANTKFNRITSALKNVPRAMNKIYQSEDEIFKIYGFLVEEARYKRAGFTESQARERAAEIITNTYPNYAKIPNIVRLIGKFPLFGTFVAFNSESLRVSYNNAILAKSELTSSNPTVRKIGVERLSGILVNNLVMGSAVTGLMSTVGLSYFAGEGEEDEEIYGTKLSDKDPGKMFRLIVPHYNKTGSLSIIARGFLKGDNKKSFEGQLNNDAYIDFFDYSKLDGTGYYKNMIRIILGETPIDEDSSKIIDLFQEFFAPFLGLDITIQSADDAKKLFEDLKRKGYSNAEASAQASKLLLDDLLPSMLENGAIAMEGLIANEETDILLSDEMEDQDQTIPADQAALRLLGITLQRVNVNKALFFGVKSRYNKMKRELEDLGMKFTDLNNPDVLGIVDSNKDLQSKLQDIMNLVSSCKHFGDLEEQDIDAVLSAVGVSSYIKNYIKNNKEPFTNLK